MIAATCITFTSSVLLGSISIYFSVYNRRAHSVILKTFLTVVVLFVVLPGLLGMMFADSFGGEWIASPIYHTNPYLALLLSTELLLEGTSMPAGFPFLNWGMHCVIVLGAAVGILALCVRVVRRVALQQALGEAGEFPKSPKRKAKEAARAAKRAAAAEPTRYWAATASDAGIRPVVGSPVVWKELRAPLVRRRMRTIVGSTLIVIILLLTYALIGSDDMLDEEGTHVFFGVAFAILGIISTCVLSATTITSEKESRTWPLLLSTTLTDRQILLGKAVGVIRRTAPTWLLLAGHMVIFGLIGYVHPAVWFHLFILAAWIIVFFTGIGIYLGTRFKRTSASVAVSLGLALALWLVVPIVVMFVADGSSHYGEPGITEVIYGANPVVQAAILTGGSGGEYHADRTLAELEYRWDWESFGSTTGIMIAYAAVYMGIGVLCVCLARRRLRRNIF